jgi:hypothetical protein
MRISSTSTSNLTATALATTVGISLLLGGCSPAQFQSSKATDSVQSTEPIVPEPTAPPSPSASGKAGAESFLQDNSANKVDILIIDDNSSSMDIEQQKMATRFSSFISGLSTVDYQMAMTTTDLESANFNQHGYIMNWAGTKSPILTPQTKNADQVFKNSIARTETIDCANKPLSCPSGNEQPLLATIKAIDARNTVNAGFFRNGVDLSVIVLSDEDEESDGPPTATKPADVVTAFNAAFGNTKKLSVYGIVIKPGDAACLKMQTAQLSSGYVSYYGTHVNSLAGLTGGSVASICDADFSKNLSAIGNQIRHLIGTFTLQHSPIVGTVAVSLTPSSRIGFKTDGNKVIFDTPPPAGTKIEISYKY